MKIKFIKEIVFLVTLVATTASPMFVALINNPRTAGGGAVIHPLRCFADSEKTAARSAAKFVIAVQSTI